MLFNQRGRGKSFEWNGINARHALSKIKGNETVKKSLSIISSSTQYRTKIGYNTFKQIEARNVFIGISRGYNWISYNFVVVYTLHSIFQTESPIAYNKRRVVSLWEGWVVNGKRSGTFGIGWLDIVKWLNAIQFDTFEALHLNGMIDWSI